MSSRTISVLSSSPVRNYSSPSRVSSGGSQTRKTQPTPESERLRHNLVISRTTPPPAGLNPEDFIKAIRDRQHASGFSQGPRQTSSSLGTQPPLQQYEVDIETDEDRIAAAAITSRHIQLDFPILHDHKFRKPSRDDFPEIARLFPTTFAVELCPPFLILRVKTLPPKPWPLTIGGCPLKLTTSPNEDCFDRHQGGRGPPLFHNTKLWKDKSFNNEFLGRVIEYFHNASIRLRTICWFDGFWMASLPDEVDEKLLPGMIGGAPIFYHFNVPELVSAGLRKTIPYGTVFDDNCYLTVNDSMLRPGIQLSSSSVDGRTTFTTSGVRVVDKEDNVFITGAAHGFKKDGKVYHPNHTGTHIGDVVRVFDDSDIALIQLKAGVKYENKTFGSAVEGSSEDGVQLTRICTEMDIRYDHLFMNNPYGGECWGTVLGEGALVSDNGTTFVRHKWTFFENQEIAAPPDGTCGTAVHTADGELVGLYRYLDPTTNLSVCMSANELLHYGVKVD